MTALILSAVYMYLRSAEKRLWKVTVTTMNTHLVLVLGAIVLTSTRALHIIDKDDISNAGDAVAASPASQDTQTSGDLTARKFAGLLETSPIAPTSGSESGTKTSRLTSLLSAAAANYNPQIRQDEELESERATMQTEDADPTIRKKRTICHKCKKGGYGGFGGGGYGGGGGGYGGGGYGGGRGGGYGGGKVVVVQVQPQYRPRPQYRPQPQYHPQPQYQPQQQYCNVCGGGGGGRGGGGSGSYSQSSSSSQSSSGSYSSG